MIAGLARWLDRRVGAAGVAREGMRKVFPEHWSFLLGELALNSFVVLLLTGTFLAFFFEPSTTKLAYDGAYGPLTGVEVSAAYRSVLELSFAVPAGLLIRQIHHWAALVFVAAIVVHLLRVLLTGAFRRPRELNWMVGLTLLALGIFNGFSGYSLPDDLLSGTGLRIAFSIVQSVPLVGDWLAFLAFDGEFPGEAILQRLFIAHVFVVPLLMLGLVAVHLGLVVRHKHTQFPGGGRTDDNVVGQRLWPTYTAKSLGLMLLTFATLTLLGGMAQINPVWLYGPFEPTTVTTGAQPDWYLGWVEGALRLMPSWEARAFGVEIPNPFWPAVLLPALTFAALYAWPFVEARLVRDDVRREHHLLQRPREHPWRTGLVTGGLSFYTVLFVAGSSDVVAESVGFTIGTLTNVLRVLALVLPLVVATVTVLVCDQLRAAERHRLRRDHLRRMELARERS